MNKYLKIAVDNNYFVKVTRLRDINGCIVNFPHNIFLKQKAVTYIYAIESDCIAIYNKSFDLINRLECDKFASRAIILFDIFLKAHKIKVLPTLILCFEKDNILGDYTVLKDMFDFYGDEVLEQKLIQALPKIADESFIVSKDIREIYNIIKSQIIAAGEILC